MSILPRMNPKSSLKRWVCFGRRTRLTTMIGSLWVTLMKNQMTNLAFSPCCPPWAADLPETLLDGKVSKCIDWCMHSLRTPNEVSFRGVQNDIVFSDHKGIWLGSSFASGSPWKGRIKPSPAWLKPSSLAAEDWIQQLELSWNEVEQSSSYHELVHSVQNLDPIPKLSFRKNGINIWIVCNSAISTVSKR